MNTINIKRFGLAFGITGAILYFGCIILMATVGREGSILFFNNLLHGLDISSVIRMNVPLWEAFLGIIEIFILGWLVGICIAAIYNLSIKKSVET
ncbi:MAG TPA: DUF5676 family membrane protein [Bacteroidales bacterium]